MDEPTTFNLPDMRGLTLGRGSVVTEASDTAAADQRRRESASAQAQKLQAMSINKSFKVAISEAFTGFTKGISADGEKMPLFPNPPLRAGPGP
jgi:hypothetical protein